MEQHSALPQDLLGQRELVDGKFLAFCQWRDADIAMNVARRYFETWLHGDHRDTSAAIRLYAYHTHEALHEAARAIDVLIETLRVEAQGPAFKNGGEHECLAVDHATPSGPINSGNVT